MNNLNIPKKAFSMIELAVFITVISFVLVAFALSLSGDVETNKVSLTKKRMDKIYNALGVFVAQNSRFPCPAAIDDVLSDSTYGDEGRSSGNCITTSGSYFTSGDLVYGMVPIKALGLTLEDSVDGFDSKFVYVIDKNFAEDSTYATALTSSDGGITIKNYINGSSSNVTTTAVFAVMSYGKNKKGAFNMNSATQISASSDTDEVDNGSASLNTDFVAFSDRGTFDDIVLYRDNKIEFLTDFGIYNLYDDNRSNFSQ